MMDDPILDYSLGKTVCTKDLEIPVVWSPHNPTIPNWTDSLPLMAALRIKEEHFVIATKAMFDTPDDVFIGSAGHEYGHISLGHLRAQLAPTFEIQAQADLAGALCVGFGPVEAALRYFFAYFEMINPLISLSVGERMISLLRAKAELERR